MKINDIFEEINKNILDRQRKEENLEDVKGHIIGVTRIIKMIGPYKRAHTDVIYVNMNTNKNTVLFACDYDGRSDEDFEDKATINVMLSFIVFYAENKMKLLKGDYGNR